MRNCTSQVGFWHNRPGLNLSRGLPDLDCLDYEVGKKGRRWTSFPVGQTADVGQMVWFHLRSKASRR